MDEFDYIVIGSGSSGSTVAGRLSESGKDKVLVLEAGGSDRTLPISMPAASYLYALANPRYDWKYMSLPDPTRNNRIDYVPRGKVLGGTGSINGMCYVRGQKEDFDDWEALYGCKGWNFESVLPYFRRSEHNENGENRVHGIGGPLPVSNLRTVHPLSKAFLQAGVNAGLERTDDINAVPQKGIGFLQTNQKFGRRYSSSRAYLWPAMKRSNVDVRKHAQVSKILFSGLRATGVQYIRGGKQETARATKGVILSAGVIASPQLLMVSGIGPAEHLRSHNIPVVLDVPGVGRNYHDHASINHTAWVNRPTYNVQNTILHKLLYGIAWLAFGRGPGSTPDCHVIGYLSTDRASQRSNIQYHFSPVGFDFDENGPILFDRPAMSGFTNISRPRSRGSIELASPDIRDYPAIQPNMFADERDLEELIVGAKFLRKIFQSDPIASYVVDEHSPGSSVKTDDEWRAYVRERAGSAYHPAGSCKMGTDDMAVVDERLKLRGVEGLYVVDASIMPLVTSANLNANCIMIGEKFADMIREKPPAH